MTRTRLANWLSLSFLAASAIATFAQCGAEGDGANTGRRAATPRPSAQDPAPAPTPPADTLRLLISGTLSGKLEPCGCASGQLGGLARRMQHVGEQRTYDVLIEGGGLVDGATELDVLKLFTISTVLFQMARPYDVLGVDLTDLAVPRDEWSAFLAGAPVVATNLRSDAPEWPARPFAEKVVRDFTVRTASLLLPELPAVPEGAPQLARTDPATAWREAFADAAEGTFRIALLHGQDAQVRALLPTLDPAPDLAIAVDPGYIEPAGAPTMVGDVPLVFAGIRGRVLLDARLWRENGKPRVVCELVPLAGSKTVPGGGGDPAVKDAILQHRLQVEADDVLAKMAGREKTANGAAYVGSETCRACHPSAMAAYEKTAHAHAWRTLVDAEKDPKRYGWPVTAYPDCVACHVVGYGEQTGFATAAKTPHLVDVGCEQCHGAGSMHAATNGAQPLGIARGLLPSVMCTECHDFEQSPEFVYGDRWTKIQHGLEPAQQKARAERQKQGGR